MILTLPLVATASAVDCVALDESEFRSSVLDAQASIDRGDIELSAVILSEVQDRLPCLAFAPAPRMWADLLVAMAIVEFNRGGSWQAPMSAALRIRPGIDRGVAQSHPLAHWTPPKVEAEPGVIAPDHVEFYVDGLKSTQLPPAQGLWLVQKHDGRFWNSLVLHDAVPPSSWIEDPVEQPPRIAVWVRAGLVAGPATNAQTSSWGSDLYLEHGWVDRPGLALGVAADLHATFFSPLGVLISGAAPLAVEATALDGRISGVWTIGGLSIGPTLATSSADTYETDRLERRQQSHQLLYPGLTWMLRARRPGGETGLDVSMSAGLSAAMVRGEASVGGTVTIAGELCHFGVVGIAQRARFAQPGLPGRIVETSAARLLFRADWVWGEY